MNAVDPHAIRPEALILTANGHHPRLNPTARVAPTAVVAGDVHLDAGVSIWYGAVVRAEYASVRIGADTNVQDGAVVHVDPDQPADIGVGVSVGHHAVLHGCTIADSCLIGISATVLNGAVVPAHSLVAAGSVVLDTLEAEEGWLIAGTPASPRRPLREDELEHLAWGVKQYQQCTAAHPFGAKSPRVRE